MRGHLAGDLLDSIPWIPCGTQGLSNSFPPCSVLGSVLGFLPAQVTCLQLFLTGSSPCRLGSTKSSLVFGVPFNPMTDDIAGCFPEGVANPSPILSGSLLGDGVLVCPLPQDFVADLWPPDVEDVAKAAVDEGLQFGG